MRCSVIVLEPAAEDAAKLKLFQESVAAAERPRRRNNAANRKRKLKNSNNSLFKKKKALQTKNQDKKCVVDSILNVLGEPALDS